MSFSLKLFFPPLIHEQPGPAILVASIIFSLFFFVLNQFPIIVSVFPYDSELGGTE